MTLEKLVEIGEGSRGAGDKNDKPAERKGTLFVSAIKGCCLSSFFWICT